MFIPSNRSRFCNKKSAILHLLFTTYICNKDVGSSFIILQFLIDILVEREMLSPSHLKVSNEQGVKKLFFFCNLIVRHLY